MNEDNRGSLTETDLADLLHRTAGRVAPGEPQSDLVRRGRRARRRRTVMGIGSAVVVCSLVVGAGVGVQRWSAQHGQASIASGEPKEGAPDVASPVPDRYQRIGVGGLHIDLPAHWRRGTIRCGTAQAEAAWRFDGDAVPLCAQSVPEHGTEVTLGVVPSNVTLDREGTEVSLEGGGVGFRSPVRCGTESGGGATVERCEATLWDDTLDRGFFVTVTSTLGSDAVDDLLDSVRHGSQVGIPAPHGGAVNGLGDEVTEYVTLLEQLGLAPSTHTATNGRSIGPAVRLVAPEPGTLVPRGTEVDVEVARW